MINQIQDINKVEELISTGNKVVFYKHSNRCSVAFDALREIKYFLEDHPIEINLIDVVRSRSVSNFLEEKSNIRHESPQIIIYENGKAEISVSHFSITEDFLKEHLL